jgi:predicted nucleic acid-binding protein
VKVYWDSSALIWFYARGRINEIEGVTRSHSLAEVFSGLSGAGVMLQMPDGTLHHRRYSPQLAAEVVRQLHARLTYHDLDAGTVVMALSKAREISVQGGRVHDLLHAVAAQGAGADELWTTDRNDFARLGDVPVRNLAEDTPAA